MDSRSTSHPPEEPRIHWPPGLPQRKRPTVFWRGYDVFDQTKVGFVTDSPEAKRVGTRMDTISKGGGNQGHEFGTGLSAAEKDALVEYLKTL